MDTSQLKAIGIDETEAELLKFIEFVYQVDFSPKKSYQNFKERMVVISLFLMWL